MARKSKKQRVKQEEDPAVKEEAQEDDKEEEPTDEVLRSHIKRLIPLVNLQNTGVKAFTKLLSKECGGADLKPRSKFIKQALSDAINAMDESEDDEDDDDPESDDEDEKPEKKKRTTGLSMKKEISSELASFMGISSKEEEDDDPSSSSTTTPREASRTEIVKFMWDYIKENELQNPENKREIFLDTKMKSLFGCNTFTMFTMNKYIGAHIHPYKPVDLSAPSAATIKKKNAAKAASESRKRNKSSSSSSNSRKGGGKDDEDGDKKRKPKKPGLQPPYRLSDALAEIVGTDILPRPQVVKGIWAYIKKHDLQDPKDKREILCDDKLKIVMGGNKKVTMFNMNRYVTDHLIEKLDKSEYNHDEKEAELFETK
ncbi:MAG: upstream activation factor subunit UAF30 [Bacillariaceae sp.]|jgi:upstream activation factor subunit UAF30